MSLNVCFLQVKLQDQPDGYEFSIKTPVTPARWQDYDEVSPGMSALPYPLLPLLASLCTQGWPTRRQHVCQEHASLVHA